MPPAAAPEPEQAPVPRPLNGRLEPFSVRNVRPQDSCVDERGKISTAEIFRKRKPKHLILMVSAVGGLHWVNLGWGE